MIYLAAAAVLAVTWAVYRVQARADELVTDREEPHLWP